MRTRPSPLPSPTEARAKLWELIKDIRFAMFTTRHANGYLHSRPMTTQNRGIDADDRLYFFMSRANGPVDDVRNDASVNVVYADPGKDSYVSVSGNARVVDDMARKEQLWSKMNDAWFPRGPTDPDVALVEVQIIQAHYWDIDDSKIVQLFKMAAAAVTGSPPQNLGEHAAVRMH
ncbi:MAG: pyridoxamine 5'-phosphate oxidase family protein [Rhodoferax sp.]|jgi:general stress protein 26|nr:pyridoxamine 5'-phosphate oxidase family protein [Rhodoferax sp.]